MELTTAGDIRVDVSSLNETEDASSVHLVTSRVLGVAEEKTLDYDRLVVFRIGAHILRGDPNGPAAVIACDVARVVYLGCRMCGDPCCDRSNDVVVSWSQASRKRPCKCAICSSCLEPLISQTLIYLANGAPKPKINAERAIDACWWVFVSNRVGVWYSKADSEGRDELEAFN
jgi:hypothetical protein